MIQQGQNQPQQKDDHLKQQLQSLCRQPQSIPPNQIIQKKYEVRQSSQSVKFITFLITLFIGVICVFSIELYTQDQSQNNINGSSTESKMKEELTNKQIMDPEHKLSTIHQKYHQLQRKVQNLHDSTSKQNRKKNDGDLPRFHNNDQVQQILKIIKQIKQEIQTTHKNMEDETQNNKREIKELNLKIQQIAKQQNGKDVQDDRIQNQQNKKNAIMLKEGRSTFKPPKILWLYEQKPNKYLFQLIQKSIKYFAKKSQYQIITVNADNFKNYITIKLGQKADLVIDTLRQRLLSGKSGNLNNHISQIIKQLILLSVLSENGGVITSGLFAMTEDLTWLENISNNAYANRGNKGSKPQVVGFYSPYYSSKPNKENIKPFLGMSQTDKFLTPFPAMENYFIAAEENSTLITQVIQKVSSLLLSPHKFKLQRQNYVLNNLHGEDMYYEYFLIAVQIILQNKQKQLDLKMKDTYRHFAVDYYGLYLINCLYYPYKLKNFYNDHKPYKIFDSMTQFTLEQFQNNVGPLRYIVRITPQGQINNYLQDSVQGKRKRIMEGSFFQRIFFPEEKNHLIIENAERPFTNTTGQPWSTLPKIIWVFWDKGLLNSKISNQICVQNLRRMGKLSGFKIIEVNLSNVDQYLDATTLATIEYTLKHAKMLTYPQSQGDLYRLALVAKHGGVYMDASYIGLQNFDWLVNISQYPSQYIFNRFGNLPKVFMLFHPHYGSPFQWTINKKYNTKSHWHISYENNFIAAQKESDLINDWFSLLLSLYLKSFDEVMTIFQKCKIIDHRWIRSDWHYLLAMDAIKCVLGQRQILLANESKWQGASDYYKVWSMSGYLGQQKLRSNTNYENMGSNDNLFTYRYSQEYVQGIIGKIRHVTKFYSFHNEQLSKFITRHIDGNFTENAHPQSVFMRYMWNYKYSIENVNSNMRLKVTK